MPDPKYVVCHAARCVAPFASMHLRRKDTGVPATLCGILARQDCPYFSLTNFGLSEPPFDKADWCKTCSRHARRIARRMKRQISDQSNESQADARDLALKTR